VFAVDGVAEEFNVDRERRFVSQVGASTVMVLISSILSGVCKSPSALYAYGHRPGFSNFRACGGALAVRTTSPPWHRFSILLRASRCVGCQPRHPELMHSASDAGPLSPGGIRLCLVLLRGLSNARTITAAVLFRKSNEHDRRWNSLPRGSEDACYGRRGNPVVSDRVVARIFHFERIRCLAAMSCFNPRVCAPLR